MCIRKRLPRERGVHVGIEDGGQCQDAFAAEKLSRMQRRILDRFSGRTYGGTGHQESKKMVHGGMGSAAVVRGMRRQAPVVPCKS